jgi:hypothetical protein
MPLGNADLDPRECGAHEWEAFARGHDIAPKKTASDAGRAAWRMNAGALARPCHAKECGAEGHWKSQREWRKQCAASRRTALDGRRESAIRQKVIGHRLAAIHPRFGGSRHFGNGDGVLAMLHQPARKHGGRVLLDPKIEKIANLLAEIGCVAQTREFVALQGSARSREQELPGRLRFVAGHKTLLREAGDTVTL